MEGVIIIGCGGDGGLPPGLSAAYFSCGRSRGWSNPRRACHACDARAMRQLPPDYRQTGRQFTGDAVHGSPACDGCTLDLRCLVRSLRGAAREAGPAGCLSVRRTTGKHCWDLMAGWETRDARVRQL
jgi:hypothetical protein